MDAPERLMRPQRAGRAEEGEGPRDARLGRPETLRVWLLGGFRVSVGTHAVEEGAWRLRKAASLVKLLALAPGHHLHRERAMDLLWPEHGRRAAANNLSQTLHAARRALGPDDAKAASSYLASQGEQLVLCPGGELWLDVEAFGEAAATARRSREPAAHRAALNLYAGELLPRDPYEEWAEIPRESLRQLFLALLVELASLHEERGEYGPGIEALRRALVEEPTREEAHIGLMRLYALGGRQAEALAQYARLEESPSRELGAEPQAASRALSEEIATGRFPPPHRPVGPPKGEIFDPTRHNLPAPRTSFVGRDREMVEVKRALSMTRLLTLTGAGGSGKTRLALEVARDLVGAYPDGVWLVELATLSEEVLVPKAVAEALGVLERPAEPLADTLADVLRDRQSLLIVDNCEHLIEAAAGLVDKLLDACPRVRILATSREALGVEGEVRWPVSSLSVPEPRPRPSSEQLEGYESVRLFVERARGRDPAFSLSSQNALAVAEICWRLEGIPLAIELAAARVGTLSLGQIAERLGESLELLTHGGRTAMPRQRTLKGTLDWSHDLLPEAEKVLFRRLSTFSGGWTLEASEAVTSSEGVAKGEVLDLLYGLAEKSLVVAEGIGQGDRVRHRLLEPIRQYAREKLEESGEAEAAMRAHAGHFLAMAEEAEPELFGPRDVEWLERLEKEHDNIRAALSWAPERGEVELALRLAGALWMFWQAHGHSGEGRKWLEEALAKDDRASVAARLKALEAQCWMASDQRDFGRVEAIAQEGIELVDEAEIGKSFAASFRTMLGYTAQLRGDHEQAKELLEESLVVCKELGDKMVGSESLEGLACIAVTRGEAEQAARLFGAGEALREAVGYQHSPEEDALREPYLAAASSQLDEATWEATLAEGRTMELEEAVEYALSEDDSSMIASRTPEQTSATPRPLALTRREREVAKLVARGLTNRQIAEGLVLSERTVENHVSNILKKLNLSSRSEVAAWVEVL